MIQKTRTLGRRQKMNIFVEESKRNIVEKPEYLLKMDKIFFKDGTEGVITNADQNEVEIMITSRLKIKKEEIEKFMNDSISHVERAECFEIG